LHESELPVKADVIEKGSVSPAKHANFLQRLGPGVGQKGADIYPGSLEFQNEQVSKTEADAVRAMSKAASAD
jgi:hypothetical protein